MGQLKALLAFTRIPGNALSFWIRQTLGWSRGKPTLYQESKDDLFHYLTLGKKNAETRATILRKRYYLEPLADLSTTALYRKNLYLIDALEKATEGLSLPDIQGQKGPQTRTIRAMDVGSQDWHYVFGLEKWLRFSGCTGGRAVTLQGLELDGYGIYADFHSRKDYAEAYAQQTGNPVVHYSIGDFLKFQGDASHPKNDQSYALEPKDGFDFISIFYPFVTRYQLLLWGLPLRFFSPPDFLSKAASLIRQDGWLLVFCHTEIEHNLFVELGKRGVDFELLRQGPVKSNLVDFYAEIQDRHFSLWTRI